MIALVGDGAMQMIGINGLITVGEVLARWRDPRLVVMVLNNQDLNQVTWEQRVLAGDPKFEASQDAPGLPVCRLRRDAGPARHPRRAAARRSDPPGTRR